MKLIRVSLLLALIFVSAPKPLAEAESNPDSLPPLLEAELLEALASHVSLFQHLRTWLSSGYGDNPDSQRDETYRQYLHDLRRFGLQPSNTGSCRSSLFPKGPRPEEEPQSVATGRLDVSDPCYPRRMAPNVRGPVGLEFDERPTPPEGEEGTRAPTLNHGGSGHGGGAGRRRGD